MRGRLQVGQAFDVQRLVYPARQFGADPGNGLKHAFRFEGAAQALQLHPAAGRQHLLDGQ